MGTRRHFKRKNVPHKKIEIQKEFIRSRPDIARRNPEDCDSYEVSVFGGNHDIIVDDLHEALELSGFLAKYPLHSVDISPM
jgi:hypothetical protein